MKFQSMVNRLLPLATRSRYYYELGLIGIRVILNKGWRSFFRKVRFWLRLRGGDVLLMGCSNETDKIAKLWGERARETLDERNRLLSWDSHPYTMAYINRRISGDANERWLQFVKRRFCPQTLGMGLSLGSGWGGLERDALGLHVCQCFDAYDISPQAIAVAKVEASKQGFEQRINYYCSDLNTVTLEPNKYDICFAGAVLHHISSLEHLLEQILCSLHPGGLFVIIEYVGPARYQWSDKVEVLMNRILEVLPQSLKVSLRDGKTTKGEVRRPLVEDVVAVDPSEAIRSDEILLAVQEKFEVIYHADFGGTLLQFVLADIVGNFNTDDPKDRAILELMTFLEEILVDEKLIPSYFTFLVARRPG